MLDFCLSTWPSFPYMQVWEGQAQLWVHLHYLILIILNIMLTRYISRYFGRLVRTKISQYKDVFEMAGDKEPIIQSIEHLNKETLRKDKSYTMAVSLQELFNVCEGTSYEIAGKIFTFDAFSPISMKKVTLTQTLTNNYIPIHTSPSEIDIPYSPNHSHLRTHYSVHHKREDPFEFSFHYGEIYIFNLPSTISENDIMEATGASSATISYCKLDLPAFASLKFKKKDYLAGLQQVKVKDKLCPIVRYENRSSAALDRRQLVIKDVESGKSYCETLLQFSRYGRILDFHMPYEIYRQPSEKEIRKLYKYSDSPVKINIHKKDGKIESYFYPEYKPSKPFMSQEERKKEEYRRRMRHCENIQIYEGEQNSLKMRPRGFCIITYSQEEEAQNCYYKLRGEVRMDLLKGREEFVFDKRHKQALLRFIDNEYIKESFKYKKKDEEQNDILEDGLINKLLFKKFYDEKKQEAFNKKSTVENLKKEVQEVCVEKGIHGKSFEDLVKEELYGKQRKEPRPILFTHQQKEEQFPFKKPLQRVAEGMISYQKFLKRHNNFTNQQYLEKQYYRKRSNGAGRQNTNRKPRRKFSTAKNKLEENIPKQMKYDKFLKDTVDEYMGVFPDYKLNPGYERKLETFLNPQYIINEDGSEYINYSIVKRLIKIYSLNPEEDLFEFQKNVQIAKSLNFDFEQFFMKNFEQNRIKMMKFTSENGIVTDTFEYTGNNIENDVKELNRLQAEFGEKYSIITDEQGKMSVVKIAKTDFIFPFQSYKKLKEKIGQPSEKTKYDILGNYIDFIEKEKELPEELVKKVNLKENTVYSLEDFIFHISAEFDIDIKDLECFINIRNYSVSTIQESIELQQKLKKLDTPEYSDEDYSKDPSRIEVKGRDGKFKVSKYKQM